MSRSVTDRLVNVYLSNIDLIEEGLPVSVNSCRAAALETLNLGGLPAYRSERYRYTDIISRFNGDYEHYFARPQAPAIVASVPYGLDARVVRVVNGFVVPQDEFTESESGVATGSLATAAGRMPETVGEYYGSIAPVDEPLAALNTAFMRDGAFIYVPSEIDGGTIVIDCAGGADGEDVMSFGRHLIIVGDAARCNIVLKYANAGNGRVLMDECFEIVVGESAEVELTAVCDMDVRSTLVLGAYVRQGKGSKFTGMNVGLGCGLCRTDINVDIDGEEAGNNVYGVYVAGEGEHFDYNTLIRHRGERSESDQRFKGIAFGDGVGVFSGLIYVDRAAQHTTAYQNNASLVMGDRARIYTRPQLEIYADNVKCSHGATVGQLDQNALYYMRQRGISLDDARKLQMFGFVNDIVGRLSDEELAREMNAAIEGKIEHCAGK